MVTLAVAFASLADVPAGYYSSLNGKSEAELKTAIYKLVRNFTQVSSYSALPQYFQRTDVYPDSRRWWDMYSDIPLYAPSFSGLNREHSFPKSWWGGSTDVPAYVDLNHLYPSEMRANSAKSNYPLGVVSSASFNNGVCKVGTPATGQGGGSRSVFEPDDEYKGDFARTYFYMATAYQDLTWRYTYMVTQNTYPTLTGWAIDLLLKWNREDPVSEKETLRNEAVYLIQNNRNPFIDCPALAELLWGDRKGEAFTPAMIGENPGPAGDPNLITPVQGMDLDFGEVAIGQEVTRRLWFHGEYLTSPLNVRIYRGDTSQFTMSGNTEIQIPHSQINSESGYWLAVTYKPTELSEATPHTARLLISGGGVSGSRGLELRGECLPVPELETPVATAATDITADSYRANWTSGDEEDVDYWVVTRTRYSGDNVTVEELQAEYPYLDIDGFSESDSESYSVQSVRLNYRSQPSNVIYVAHSGVTGVETDLPLVVYGFEGGMRFICSSAHTNARIYDISGREIMVIATVENNTDVELLPGIYMVTTDQCHTPNKVIVR